MVAEEEMDSERAMHFVNNLKEFVKEAILDALMTRRPRIRNGNDEEEDIQISIPIPAKMNNSHPAPTTKDPGIKSEETNAGTRT